MIDPFPGYSQFINWVPKPKADGKTDKVPVDTTRKLINPHDPANWQTFEDACAVAAVTGSGIGFVFSAADPFFFVDIDHCLVNGEWSPLANTIVNAFPGCYVEVSYSGEGLHIFGTGTLENHSCKNEEYGLELYTQDRFVALTENKPSGAVSTNGQTGLDWLGPNYFQPREQLAPAEWTSEPCEGSNPSIDDDELIKKMKRSKSAKSTFDGGATLNDLWTANADKLAESYSASDGRPYDDSSADAALCSHLAFWTGKDCERIERLWLASELGQREKTREREDYRRRTILNAVALCKSTYFKPDPVGTPVENVRAANQFLDLHGQLTHFQGCAYIITKHKMAVPHLGTLKPDQFKAVFGGYQFAISYEGKPVKNAFEVFTESQLYNFPKVYDSCFRPEETPGSIIAEEGLQYINTYYPVRIDRSPGDPAPFLELMAKLLPDERDRTILISYMAACVQHIGFKFQWAPLLQGAEGNGKTFLATTISKAVGEKYSHFPNPKQLAGQFNKWLYEKLFIAIEEIFIADSVDIREALKPMITNLKLEIEGKGDNQFTGDNRANFFLCSNYKDGVQKTKNDRRYCILFSAQQTADDITNSGMGGSYFPELYKWARGGGYAIISDYLLSYAIPEEFNPAGACHRAPVTTSTREAIKISLGGAEQEILEAIEQDRRGFRGGWISSIAVENLLQEKRKRVPLNKRKALIEGLGYHHRGRMNNASAADDMKKPVLYAKNGAKALYDIMPGAPTSQAYTKAQMKGV